MKFSATTNGFYDADIHGENIPDDAVEITAEEYAALFEDQSLGKCIQSDSDGLPVAVDHVPSTEELASAARTQRDAMISDVAWRYERHARELRLSLIPTDDLATLDTYMQALADLTKQAGFPDSITWPVAP